MGLTGYARWELTRPQMRLGEFVMVPHRASGKTERASGKVDRALGKPERASG